MRRLVAVLSITGFAFTFSAFTSAAAASAQPLQPRTLTQPTQSLILPLGIGEPGPPAFDPEGNLYVPDYSLGHGEVLERTPAGAVSGAVENYTGVNEPDLVGADSEGDVFTTDGYALLMYPAGGGAAVTLPMPTASVSGMSVDAAGDLFLSVGGDQSGAVEELPVGGATTNPLSFSGLDSPQGLAVDESGDVFVADSGNNRVVELSATGVQSTVGLTGITDPREVAVDAAGDLFVLEGDPEQVVELPHSGTRRL